MEIDIIQTIGIIGSLSLTTISIWFNRRSQKVGHLLSLSQNYQKIRENLMENPDLMDIYHSAPRKTTIEPSERFIVQQVIAHLYTVYVAIKLEQLDFFKGMELDIKRYFSLPLPRKVWDEMKKFQDDGFVEYIEGIL